MYTELIGIKSMDETLNNTVNDIQQETKEWKWQLKEVTNDVAAVKDSLNMAHNITRISPNPFGFL